MRAAPSPARLFQYPAVGGTALLATVVSIERLARPEVIGKLVVDDHAFHGEPWRLLTSALPHGSPLHLIFNVYWTWVIGSALEERFGHFRVFAAMVLMAAVPLAAEYAFFGAGIGLSGVGYGLFGWAWMVSRREPRFADVVDARTVQMFIGWGILCVIMTVTGIYPVANVAHGVGLLLGVCIGLATYRPAWSGAIVATCALSIAAATVGRPYVNLDRARSAHILAYAGQQALDAGNTEEAIRLFRKAVQLDPKYNDNLDYALLKAGR
jgi:membrane associated rhomboid family serine protease